MIAEADQMKGISLCVRADYARLVSGFVSTEEARYYLKGFLAEPAPQGHDGAVLAATDGYRIGVMRDEEGFAEPTQRIWALSKETLKACKSGRDPFARWLVIAIIGEKFRLSVVMATSSEEAVSIAASEAPDLVVHTALIAPIDGTFPDYRRAMPAELAENDGGAMFNHKLLAPFLAVAEGHRRLATCLGIRAMGPTYPAFILCGRSDFIGVLMPMRGDPTLDRSWLSPAPAVFAS